MAEGRYPMAAFEVGDRLLPALDAVEEVADVAAKLIELIAALIGHCRCPELGFHRLAQAGDSADGLAVAGELRHRVFRADDAVGSDGEAAARYRERALCSVEHERRAS